MTALSSCFLSSQTIHLCKMQQLIHLLLDIHLFCPHLSNINRTVYRSFARPSNSSTNTWRRNTSTGRLYKLLYFNCATCFSLRSEQFPSVILPLKTRLADELKLGRSTPEGSVGPPRAKANNSANANFQSPTNTLETPRTTAQNLQSRTSKFEKNFGDETANYSSITAGASLSVIFVIW